MTILIFTISYQLSSVAVTTARILKFFAQEVLNKQQQRWKIKKIILFFKYSKINKII